MVLVFLGAYFVLFALTGLTSHAVDVAEIFRTPGIQMVVFFSLYMLDDPPTSPNHYRDQIWYGLLVACAAYAFFMTTGMVYFLPLAVLIGNLAHAIHQAIATRRRHSDGLQAAAH